jgi:hypothetical protein
MDGAHGEAKREFRFQRPQLLPHRGEVIAHYANLSDATRWRN